MRTGEIRQEESRRCRSRGRILNRRRDVLDRTNGEVGVGGSQIVYNYVVNNLRRSVTDIIIRETDLP